MKRSLGIINGVMAALALSATAFAQAPKGSTLLETGPVERPKITVTAETGLGGYTSALGDSSRVGPMWGVRAGVELPRFQWIDGEVAYQGIRNGIDDPAVGDNQAIFRHNLQAFAKAGVPLGDLRPFIGAGLGISYVDVTDVADGIGPYRNDIMEEVPLGVGVEYQRSWFFASARTTYSLLFNDEFVEPTPASNNPGGNLWTGTVNVGGHF
jgi:hypothetical protein